MKFSLLLLVSIFSLQSKIDAQFMGGSSMRIYTPNGSVNITTFHYMPMYFHYGNGDPFKNAMYVIELKNKDTITCKGTMVTKNGETFIKLKKPFKDSIIYPKNTISIRNIIKKDTSTAFPYNDMFWLIEPNEAMKKKAIVIYIPMSVEMSDIYLKQNGFLTLATDDLVLKLVAGDTKAEKKAKKDHLSEAIDIFNKNVDIKNNLDTTDINKIKNSNAAIDPDDRPLTF